MTDEPRLHDYWRCFHCDSVFTDKEQAALHFGVSEHDAPACLINIDHVRWLEEQHRRAVDEDTQALRTVRSMTSDHERLRRSAEEEGYAKGIADARKHPEDLGLMRKRTSWWKNFWSGYKEGGMTCQSTKLRN